MTTAQVVETYVPANNSPIQDYVHPDELLFTFFYNVLRSIQLTTN